MHVAFRSLFVAPAVLSVACVVNGDSQGHTVRDERRFTVTGEPDLRLTTFDGAIEISVRSPESAISAIAREYR